MTVQFREEGKQSNISIFSPLEVCVEAKNSDPFGSQTEIHLSKAPVSGLVSEELLVHEGEVRDWNFTYTPDKTQQLVCDLGNLYIGGN